MLGNSLFFHFRPNVQHLHDIIIGCCCNEEPVGIALYAGKTLSQCRLYFFYHQLTFMLYWDLYQLRRVYKTICCKPVLPSAILQYVSLLLFCSDDAVN